MVSIPSSDWSLNLYKPCLSISQGFAQYSKYYNDSQTLKVLAYTGIMTFSSNYDGSFFCFKIVYQLNNNSKMRLWLQFTGNFIVLLRSDALIMWCTVLWNYIGWWDLKIPITCFLFLFFYYNIFIFLGKTNRKFIVMAIQEIIQSQVITIN